MNHDDSDMPTNPRPEPAISPAPDRAHAILPEAIGNDENRMFGDWYHQMQTKSPSVAEAARRGDDAVLAGLLDQQRDLDTARFAAVRSVEYGWVECLRVALDHGVDHHDRWMLQRANSNSMPCVALLLERGATPLCRHGDQVCLQDNAFEAMGALVQRGPSRALAAYVSAVAGSGNATELYMVEDLSIHGGLYWRRCDPSDSQQFVSDIISATRDCDATMRDHIDKVVAGVPRPEGRFDDWRDPSDPFFKAMVRGRMDLVARWVGTGRTAPPEHFAAHVTAFGSADDLAAVRKVVEPLPLSAESATWMARARSGILMPTRGDPEDGDDNPDRPTINIGPDHTHRAYHPSWGSDPAPALAAIAADSRVHPQTRLLAWSAGWQHSERWIEPCPPIPPEQRPAMEAIVERWTAEHPDRALTLLAAVGAAESTVDQRFIEAAADLQRSGVDAGAAWSAIAAQQAAAGDPGSAAYAAAHADRGQADNIPVRSQEFSR